MKKYITKIVCICFFSIPALLNAQYNFYYGNLHSHTIYSDGCKDAATTGVSTPAQAFAYAKNSYHFDFLGISEHNHLSAGMDSVTNFRNGVNDAISANVNGVFVALYGQEWGVISNGGHVLFYGIDSLIGWDKDLANKNDYEIFCAKNDYTSLFNILNNHPKSFASFCHPSMSDYNNLANTAYSTSADNAVVGTAIRSGSAFSTTTNYSDVSTSSHEDYFKKLLSIGYKVAPTLDHDNHYTTFGRAAQSRTVILSKSLNKDSLLDALKNMRFYASDDWNMSVNYTINGNFMGSTISLPTNPTISIKVNDADIADSVATIEVYSGVTGSASLPTAIYSVTNTDTLSYTPIITIGQENYYYIKVTQIDGNIAWTAPIWVTKTNPLPLKIIDFFATNNNGAITINWEFASITNVREYSLEKSADGKDFTTINKNQISLNQSLKHSFIDKSVIVGVQFYRLKIIEKDGSFNYSNIITVYNNKQEIVINSIYPNPVQSILNISINSDYSKMVYAKIYNEVGELEYKQNMMLSRGLNTSILNISSLKAGIHHLVLGEADKRLEEIAFMKN